MWRCYFCYYWVYRDDNFLAYYHESYNSQFLYDRLESYNNQNFNDLIIDSLVSGLVVSDRFTQAKTGIIL